MSDELQFSIDFSRTRPPAVQAKIADAVKTAAARAEGELAGDRCAEKAERVTTFSVEAAARYILDALTNRGSAMSGEELVDSATNAGYVAHDSRAFGPVFAKLVRDGKIRCAGFCARMKGHGTAGGRLWRLNA